MLPSDYPRNWKQARFDPMVCAAECAPATLRHLAPSASEVLRQLSVSEELQTMLDSTPRPPDQLELLTKNHSPGMWASVKSYRLAKSFLVYQPFIAVAAVAVVT